MLVKMLRFPGVFYCALYGGASYILALRALYYSVIDSNDVLVPDNKSKVGLFHSILINKGCIL